MTRGRIVQFGPIGVVAAAITIAMPLATPAVATPTTPTPVAGWTPGVAGTAHGELDVFWTDTATGHVVNRSAASGSGWDANVTDLGGTLTSGPAAVTVGRTASTTSVFGRGTTGAVYRRIWSEDRGEWGAWHSLGGNIVGTPSANCLGEEGTPTVVWARGANRHLYARVLAGGQGWLDLGGTLTSDPAAVPAVEGWCLGPEVYVLGTGGRIYYWNDVRGFQPVGGTSSAAPAAVRDRNGTWLFARGADDSALWTKYRRNDARAWSAWTRLGGVLDSAPAATTFEGRPTVIVRNPNGSLYRGLFVRGTWTWYRIP